MPFRRNPRASGGFVMRRRGLEPPRDLHPTRPSTLRVYQFRHRRVGRGEYSRGTPGSRCCVRPAGPLACRTHVRTQLDTTARGAAAHGPDEAPAGDLRLHQALLGRARVSADGARHRQGRRPGLVVDGARAPRQPREARPAAARPVEAAGDRAARPRRGDVERRWERGESVAARSAGLPLVGQVAAGQPILAEENIEDYVQRAARRGRRGAASTSCASAATR